MLPYPSSAGASKYGGGRGGGPSCANFAAAKPVMQYAGCSPSWNFQGAGYFLQWNQRRYEWEHLHRSSPSRMQLTLRCTFCYFSPCLYCRKCLISQTENASPTGKVSFEGADDGIAIAAQREFLSPIVREWRVSWCVYWCRTESRQWREFCL